MRFICLLLLLSWPAMAQDGTVSIPDKRISVGIEGGSAIVPFPTLGLDLGVALNDRWQLHATYNEGLAEVDDVDLKWRLVEIRARWNFASSFFLNFGLGQRRIIAESHATEIATGNRVKLSSEARTTGLNLGIGNYWRWNAFGLGCEWAGYYQPLSKRSDADYDDSGIDRKTQDNVNDAMKKYGETPHFSALRLFIDYSF